MSLPTINFSGRLVMTEAPEPAFRLTAKLLLRNSSKEIHDPGGAATADEPLWVAACMNNCYGETSNFGVQKRAEVADTLVD
jgi:hypothetical protein